MSVVTCRPYSGIGVGCPGQAGEVSAAINAAAGGRGSSNQAVVARSTHRMMDCADSTDNCDTISLPSSVSTNDPVIPLLWGGGGSPARITSSPLALARSRSNNTVVSMATSGDGKQQDPDDSVNALFADAATGSSAEPGNSDATSKVRFSDQGDDKDKHSGGAGRNDVPGRRGGSGHHDDVSAVLAHAVNDDITAEALVSDARTGRAPRSDNGTFQAVVTASSDGGDGTVIRASIGVPQVLSVSTSAASIGCGPMNRARVGGAMTPSRSAHKIIIEVDLVEALEGEGGEEGSPSRLIVGSSSFRVSSSNGIGGSPRPGQISPRYSSGGISRCAA